MAKDFFEKTQKYINLVASLLVDLPFKPIEDQVGVNGRLQEIPLQVIQTWEVNQFGRRHLQSLRAFRAKNLDLDFKLVDRDSRDRYIQEFWSNHPISSVYERSLVGPLKTDIFRYCILFERGGYYFDINKAVDTSLTSLHPPNARELISFEANPSGFANAGYGGLRYPKNLVAQWGLGFAPGHGILKLLIEQICVDSNEYAGVVFENPKLAVLNLSGPYAMTRAVHKYIMTLKSHSLFQVGIDYGGHGIFSIPGSGARYLQHRSYADLNNVKILSR